MSVVEVKKEITSPVESFSSKADWWNTAERVGRISLPFMKLNRNVFNVCSVVNNSLKSKEALLLAMNSSFIKPEFYYCLFEISLALAKVTAVVLGSMAFEAVVTGADVALVGVHVAQDLWAADFSSAFENLFDGMGDILWLTILLTGSPELVVGLLLYKAAASMNAAKKEWDAGRMPEVAAKMLMVGIRLNQAEHRAQLA